MTRRPFFAALAALGIPGFTAKLAHAQTAAATPSAPGGVAPLHLSDAEWKKRLTPEQYDVLRHEGTERPGSSPLNDQKHAGEFNCAGCNLPLFSSKTKYDSGTGWPSFYAPLPNALLTKTDFHLFAPRTEYHCARCEGHQGHVFNDGPQPTGKRYCNNGVALTFVPAAA